MSLSEQERGILTAAGSAHEQTIRGQAVAILLSKSGSDKAEARALLAESFAVTTQPSFHLIPRGDAMTSEANFADAYAVLSDATNGFTDVTLQTLQTALLRDGGALAPLRMVIGFTLSELATAGKLISPDAPISEGALKTLERKAPPVSAAALRRRELLITTICATVLAVMERAILTVPESSAEVFHSKLAKRDTREGWASVARDSGGVPYSALLYQRYVGGVWRQVQDAYSEVKGDAVLEAPLANLLDRECVAYHWSKRGASGATQTTQQFGVSPGPDFLLPDTNPTVIIESKVAEDGGTARDKAARIESLAAAADQRGLVTCAVIDGKGWRKRASALVDVVVATRARTYTLKTLENVMEVPEVAALRGTAPS